VTTPFARLVRTAALGLLMYTGMASGAIYRQHIDPPIFFGDGLFDVAPSCIQSGTIWEAAGTDPGECGAVDILSLLIVANANPANTITFAPPTLQDDFVTGLYWVNGILTGIDTVTLHSVGQTGAFSNSSGYDLIYASGHVGNPVEGSSPIATLSCTPVITTFSTSYHHYPPPVGDTDPGLCNALSNGGPARQEPAVLVPEPASVALIFAALGAGWLTRRRSRSA
jgi:hypothetical protein